MTIYRLIYEQHFGPIPCDTEGLPYDIHHIDGNRKNNDISNLKAVSLQEHYDIHESQGDIGACRAIRLRMKNGLTDKQILSELSSKRARERVRNGTHHWLGPEFQKRRMEEGTHPFIGLAKKRVAEGTHNFLGGDIQKMKLENGTHNFQKKYVCECCGREFNAGNLKQHLKSMNKETK